MQTKASRSILAVPSAILGLGTAALAILVTVNSDPSALDWILCGLFVLAMAWESLMVVQVGLGFGLWVRGEDARSDLEQQAARLAPDRRPRTRTAIVMPIFDEDVRAVFDGIAVVRGSLERLGPVGDIDLHLLSDTRDSDTAAAEALAAEAARRTDGPALLYRRRPDNQGRKAGNIAEFLERCGSTYDFMVVLDADSLMSGQAIRVLISLMEDNPEVGLIQTISYAANRTTLFARVQQFAIRLYAPLSLRAASIWQGTEGLYYGHNAIVRCAAFAEHARLPILPGRPPFGGEILCHDVVEAALLSRAGWAVRSLPDSEGTWEEMPTNVVDLMGRERRWCQGNLQHARVLSWPGIPPGNRLHIILGIAGYASSLVWWAFLALGAVRVAIEPTRHGLGLLAYGATEPGPWAAALLGLGIAVLLGPRILNVARALATAPEHAGFGGTGRLFASVVLEQVFSTLLTPPLSFINAGFVVQTLLGKVVPWAAQSRADREVGWWEATRFAAPGIGLGLLLAIPAVEAGGWYALWMAPTIAGLLLAPPLIVWSSRRSLGEAAARLGLFLTVDETAPAPELIELRRLRTEPAAVRVEAGPVELARA